MNKFKALNLFAEHLTCLFLSPGSIMLIGMFNAKQTMYNVQGLISGFTFHLLIEHC